MMRKFAFALAAALASSSDLIHAQSNQPTAIIPTTSSSSCHSWFQYAPSNNYRLAEGMLFKNKSSSRLYVGYQPTSINAPFTSLDACTGNVIWQYSNVAHFTIDPDTGVTYGVSPLIPLQNSSIFAVANSELLWSTSLSGGLGNLGAYQPPALIAFQGVVLLYAQLLDSTLFMNETVTPSLYAFNSKTGNLLWSVNNSMLYSDSCASHPNNLELIPPYEPNHVNFSSNLFVYAVCGTSVFAIDKSGNKLFQYDAIVSGMTVINPNIANNGATGIVNNNNNNNNNNNEVTLTGPQVDLYANNTNASVWPASFQFATHDLFGNLWISVNGSSNIGRINADTGMIDRYLNITLDTDITIINNNQSSMMVSSLSFGTNQLSPYLYPLTVGQDELKSSSSSTRPDWLLLMLVSTTSSPLSTSNPNVSVITNSFLEARNWTSPNTRLWRSDVSVTGVASLPFLFNGLIYWPIQNMTDDGTLGASQLLLLSPSNGQYLAYYSSVDFGFSGFFNASNLTCHIIDVDVTGTAFMGCGSGNIAAIPLNDPKWKNISVPMNNTIVTGNDENQGSGPVSGNFPTGRPTSLPTTSASPTPSILSGMTQAPTPSSTGSNGNGPKSVIVSPNDSNSSSGLSTGAKAGIAVGCSVAGILLIVAIVMWVRRQKLPATAGKPAVEQPAAAIV